MLMFTVKAKTVIDLHEPINGFVGRWSHGQILQTNH